MSVKQIITEIETDVADVLATQFSYIQTQNVPSSNDTALSYERGRQKSGKTLETCVLYVDIRNSIALNEAHRSITMGKIYTAFTKAVIKAARHHGGHTRNIIGDRVMIVFPRQRCFSNAVECAITINHIAEKILNSKFSTVDFRCGIGIDYGMLKVIKVGIQRNGTEGPENKGLVWAGYPANYASRLTDMANKTIIEEYYEVIRNPINPVALLRRRLPGIGLLSKFHNPVSNSANVPFYLTTTETIEMNESEFAKSFMPDDITKSYSTNGGRMITFKRKTRTIVYSPILITEAVYQGLVREGHRPDLAKQKDWKEQKRQIRNVDGKVYGSVFTWKIAS
jgi:adenylate cyclase